MPLSIKYIWGNITNLYLSFGDWKEKEHWEFDVERIFLDHQKIAK